MYRIKVYTVGKTKEEWLQKALAEYEARLKPFLLLEWVLAKSDAFLIEFVEKEKSFICLDPQGKQFSSEAFSHFLLRSLQDCDSRLCFVIGGAEGLPPALTKVAKGLISLSLMTFTHQMTRLILIEQIYRAMQIDRGTSYHK